MQNLFSCLICNADAIPFIICLTDIMITVDNRMIQVIWWNVTYHTDSSIGHLYLYIPVIFHHIFTNKSTRRSSSPGNSPFLNFSNTSKGIMDSL